MADIVVTACPSGATLATAIAYFNSSIAALRTGAVGNLEGRGASVPNLASRTCDETSVAHNASVCTFEAEGGAVGYVVSGLTYLSASGLVATYSSGTCYIIQTSTSPKQKRRIVLSTNVTVTLTASSDNYVYVKTDGTLGAAVTSVGGPAPTLPADTLLLSIATTNGTTVTGTPVDKRQTSASVVSKFWRSVSFWPVPTSATNLRVPPGNVELGGTLFETTTNTDLDITAAGNFASGSRTSSIWCYVIAANNSGSLKIALTTSAPSAMTIIGGATTGTTGTLQCRTIGAVPYRYLSAHRLLTGGNLARGTRLGPLFHLASVTSVLSAGTSSSYTSVALSTYVPPTARLARVIAGGASGGAGSHIWLRDNGGTGTGVQLMVAAYNNSGTQVDVPTSSAQKIDYKVDTGGTSCSIIPYGYYENLD